MSEPQLGADPAPVRVRPAAPGEGAGQLWEVACPRCRAVLGPLPEAEQGPFAMACEACGLRFERRAGVWDFRLPEIRERSEAFAAEYRAVRQGEGRPRLEAEELRCLPWADPDAPFAWEWFIRATSYEALLDRVIPLFDGRRLAVLDLGAGPGWLSHRLAIEGHRPAAVDLSADPQWGLGAARHFDPVLPRPFPRLQADFDHLPLAEGSADLVVFNAAFHYSPDYALTLAEALRVLAPGGRVVIMDSPIYREAASGERMVAARKADFLARFGFASDRLGSREFLHEAEIAALGRQLGLRWDRVEPRYGWAWRLRRAYRRLRWGRESARFALLVARRSVPEGPGAGGEGVV